MEFHQRKLEQLDPAAEILCHTVETALGTLALAWRGGTLIRVVLPEADATGARTRMTSRLDGQGRWAQPGEPLPPLVETISHRLRRYGDGERLDFGDVPVDFGAIEPFSVAVYAALRMIPHGEAVTYGELARIAGFAGDARSVGGAMGRNPVPLIVPCHRVIAANGRIGGFSAPGGAVTKARLLAHERARTVSAQDAQGAFLF